MARKHYSIKSYKKSNWSHENKGVFFTIDPATSVNGLYQGGSNIVPATTSQGIRTVGNFTITVPVSGAQTVEFYWALIYVPQGQTANPMFANGGTLDSSLYEPNQYVLASGISDSTAGPIRIRSRMMRKLHSGDFISLLIGTPGVITNTTPFRALVSYSIKYN